MPGSCRPAPDPCEPDADPLAVLRRGIAQQSLDVSGVGPLAHHIQQPKTAVLIAAELDTDRPIRVVERGLFGRGEIPIADDVEIRWDLVDDGTPFPLEIEPGRRPDLPVARQQPLPFKQRQRQQPGEIFRVDLQQNGVVEHLRRDEGDADRLRRVDPGGRSSGPGMYCSKSSGRSAQTMLSERRM